MCIGFFDSGIGGLTVLREALKALPGEDFIYYADSLHAPYGTKPKDEVKKYIFEAVEFLNTQGIKALVVACNTATIVAINDLRERYDFPILGMEPAVKPAVEKNRDNNKRVLVTATPLALKEEKFHSLLHRVDDNHIVDMLPLPKLVEFAENFIFDEAVVLPYLREVLSSYDMNEYGTVVLGCTHFPLFREIFRKLLPDHISIIDGSIGTVNHLKNVLEEKNIISRENRNGKVVFYISGERETDSNRLNKYIQILK